MKDEHKETGLGGASRERQQNGGGSRPSFIPLYVLPAVRLPAFLRVPLCPPAPGRRSCAGRPGFPGPWLLRLGGEDLRKVALRCCLAVLILLVMKNWQEFIILL